MSSSLVMVASSVKNHDVTVYTTTHFANNSGITATKVVARPVTP